MYIWYASISVANVCTEGCMGEQALLEFDMTFGDVLLHKQVQAYIIR